AAHRVAQRFEGGLEWHVERGRVGQAACPVRRRSNTRVLFHFNRTFYVRGAAVDIGRVGVWHPSVGRAPATEGRQAAARIEELGYGSLWGSEGWGSKDPLVMAGIMLAATRSIVVGTGIANLWARDAMSMAGGAVALTDAYPERFLLGVGVSHAVL